MAADQAEQLLPGLDQGRSVLGQGGDGEPRQPVLAGAEHLAFAAKPQVQLGEPEAVALRGDRLQPATGELAGFFGEQQAVGFVLSAAIDKYVYITLHEETP